MCDKSENYLEGAERPQHAGGGSATGNVNDLQNHPEVGRALSEAAGPIRALHEEEDAAMTEGGSDQEAAETAGTVQEEEGHRPAWMAGADNDDDDEGDIAGAQAEENEGRGAILAQPHERRAVAELQWEAEGGEWMGDEDFDEDPRGRGREAAMEVEAAVEGEAAVGTAAGNAFEPNGQREASLPGLVFSSDTEEEEHDGDVENFTDDENSEESQDTTAEQLAKGQDLQGWLLLVACFSGHGFGHVCACPHLGILVLLLLLQSN